MNSLSQLSKAIKPTNENSQNLSNEADDDDGCGAKKRHVGDIHIKKVYKQCFLMRVRTHHIQNSFYEELYTAHNISATTIRLSVLKSPLCL